VETTAGAEKAGQEGEAEMKRATIWIICLAAAVLIGWDIYVATRPPAGDTISELTWKVAHLPVVPYSFGVLAGHLFGWRIVRRRKPVVLVITAGALALVSILVSVAMPAPCWLLAGMIMGSIFWGPGKGLD